MKILVTYFEPFGGEKINSSFKAVNSLKPIIDGMEIIKLQVETAFYISITSVINKIKEVKPDAVLCVGQAGGRSDISVERVAINIDDAGIPDNLNQQPIDIPIVKDGANAYFATIPIKAIIEEVKHKKIPASVSNTAGTYVCNHLMYGVLDYIKKNNLDIKAGFIHIPYLVEQVINKGNISSMSLDNMVIALEAAIKVIGRSIKKTT